MLARTKTLLGFLAHTRLRLGTRQLHVGETVHMRGKPDAARRFGTIAQPSICA